MRKDSVLITGSQGFIGQTLVSHLSSAYHVFGIGRHPIDQDSALTDYFQGDVTDSKFLEKIFSRQPFHKVVHLAGPTSHDELVHDRFNALKTNLDATFHLLKLFENSDATHFFYASSGKVYSPMKGAPLSETDRAEPTSVLGKNKKITEDLVRFFANESNKVYLIGRIFNCYGPNQKSSFVIPTILNQLKSNPEVQLGHLHDKRDYFYLDDLISAIDLLLHLQNGGTFNIGSGHSADVRQILDLLEKILKINIRVKMDPKKLRKGETPSEVAGIEKLKQQGWAPRITLEEGLRKVINENYPELLK